MEPEASTENTEKPCGCPTEASQTAQAQQFIWQVKQAGGEYQPQVDFNTFVLSLASSALFHLGVSPLPDGERGETNFELAHESIDILGLLQDKTRGNLSPEECELLSTVLYEVRVNYVRRLHELKR